MKNNCKLVFRICKSIFFLIFNWDGKTTSKIHKKQYIDLEILKFNMQLFGGIFKLIGEERGKIHLHIIDDIYDNNS